MPPSEKRKYHERQPRTPSVPQGPIAAGSSAMIVSDMLANPPGKACIAVKNTRIAATIITSPWKRSV